MIALNSTRFVPTHQVDVFSNVQRWIGVVSGYLSDTVMARLRRHFPTDYLNHWYFPPTKQLIIILINNNMSLSIQKPYTSPSLFKRFTTNSPPISTSELHTLHDLRSEAVTAAFITLDGNEGDIRVEPFGKVTELTVTLINAPSLTIIATALDQFPSTRTLRINIASHKAEPDSKKILQRRRNAERRTLAAPIEGLSEILSHLTALYLTGWHDDICEWICSTTSGAIQWLDIIECGRSYAAPREAELIQRLLDNNKWVYSMKLITFYPRKSSFLCG